MTLEKKILEKLAELEHEQWIAWSKAIAPEIDGRYYQKHLQRWKRLWVPYSELNESVKEQDRVWARKVLEIVDEEIGKVAQKINKTIEDTKVDMLGMFCYQGPPTKHWIETKGQFWMGWNEACNKILEKLAGLLVENSKVEGEK